MEVLVKALNTTRQALLPRVRTLEDHYLVSHDRDTYELTSIGKLIVDEMIPYWVRLKSLIMTQITGEPINSISSPRIY
jgi:predicted transcriptional regulator